MAVIVTPVAVARPTLLSVNITGELTVPTIWFPKLIVETAIAIFGVPTNPVQESATESGLLAASEAKIAVAVRAPATVGLQFTVAEQLFPAVTTPQLFESVKSPGFVPPSVTDETWRSAFPVFTRGAT